MYQSVGHVLEQAETVLKIQGIHGLPCQGVFLSSNDRSRPIELADASRQRTRVSWRAADGQGMVELKQIVPETSDSSLLRNSLVNGFVCSGFQDPVLCEIHCRIQLITNSVQPFVFSPQMEDDYVRQGDGRLVEIYAGQTLQPNIWYPIELSFNGETVVYHSEYEETAGLNFGVMSLKQSIGDGGFAGSLRFVAELPSPDSLSALILHRFGRLLGVAYRLGVHSEGASVHD